MNNTETSTTISVSVVLHASSKVVNALLQTAIKVISNIRPHKTIQNYFRLDKQTYYISEARAKQ